MRVFAANQYINNIQESSRHAGLYGATVATNDLYKNLIRFGEFDEYRFFILPEYTKKSNFQKQVSAHVNDKRVKFESISRLPSFLEKGNDFVFFTSSPAIFNIAHLRSIYAKRYFPVCGMTHTVSYAKLIYNVFFQNMICDLQPFDSIVCTSRPVLHSVRKIYDSVRKDAFRKLSARLDYKGRLDCLPLGINSEDYVKHNKNESRGKLKLPKEKIIILNFGRFSVSDKADLYPLIFAFKNLLIKNKNIFLVLAGKNFQGNYGGKLKKIAQDLGVSKGIQFFFNPSEKEKYLLYAASDIFVSPSDTLQESFGLTVLEAMAAGLTVLVSDWDGYKDLVVHQETGLRIPTYWNKCDRGISDYAYLFVNNIHAEHLSLGQSVCVDTRQMTGYLSQLIRNKGLRLRLGQKARERALAYYDWSVVIPRYEALWSALIKEARSRKAPPTGLPVFYPRYFECFKHYPSRILDKRTLIAITKEGERLIKTKKFSGGIPALNLIMPQAVLLILFYLKRRQSASIGKISEHVSMSFRGIKSDKVYYHIMWMLKHCMIEANFK